MVRGVKGSTRSVQTLLVLGLVLVLIPLVAPPPTAQGQEIEPGPRSWVVPDKAQREAATASLLSRPADAARGLAPASTSLSDRYHDYCGDSAWDDLDLRQLNIVDRRSIDGYIQVRYATCGPLSADALVGGIITWVLTPSHDEYLLDLWSDEGNIFYGLYDLSVGDYTYGGSTTIGSQGDTVTMEFPAWRIGDPAGFLFDVVALDAAFEIVDRMPEANEPSGLWPASCLVDVEARYKTITPTDGEVSTALEAVRRAGLKPSVPAADGTFSVTVADAADTRWIEHLEGVEAVTTTTLYRRFDSPSSSLTHTGEDAWWREQVGASSDRGATGSGIEIAIIDDGVDGTRAELSGRVGSGYNAVANEPISPNSNSSRGGHGNHVAGIAAGKSTDLFGIAREATVRPYQAFSFDGCATEQSVRDSIDEAVDDGVDIINMSLGTTGEPGPGVVESLDAAAAAGIILVAAAGNTGTYESGVFPASHGDVIAVGATAPGSTVAPYSTSGDWLDLVAPGGGVTSDEGIYSLGPFEGLVPASGTSMAAPFVAGAAALYLDLGGADFRNDLTGTANPLGTDTYSTSYGYGELDIAALVATAPSFSDVPTSHPFFAEIEWLATSGITTGYEDGTFRPTANVTRMATAAFFYRFAGEPEFDAPSVPSFSDVPTSHPFFAEIEWLATSGITTGYEDGTFRPTANVTRMATAAFFYRQAEAGS